MLTRGATHLVRRHLILRASSRGLSRSPGDDYYDWMCFLLWTQTSRLHAECSLRRRKSSRSNWVTGDEGVWNNIPCRCWLWAVRGRGCNTYNRWEDQPLNRQKSTCFSPRPPRATPSLRHLNRAEVPSTEADANLPRNHFKGPVCDTWLDFWWFLAFIIFLHD